MTESIFSKAAVGLKKARRRGKGDLTILGGQIPRVEEIGSFLDALNLPRSDVPFVVWETVDEFLFLRERRPELDPALFERARFFGVEGDLELRRDRDRVLWRYLGNLAPTVPPDFDPLDFWTSHEGLELLERDDCSLLWGKYNVALGRWHDDRVGWARLEYLCADRAHPHEPADRVTLHYTLLMDGGQIAFVWWKNLEPWSPEVTEDA